VEIRPTSGAEENIKLSPLKLFIKGHNSNWVIASKAVVYILRSEAGIKSKVFTEVDMV
jgi:hypothetical protein